MRPMSTAPAEVERPESDVESDVRADHPWVTIVWDDPVNLM
jgi:ATP-dependent Clp protease adaptor protein ClpS